MKIAVIGLGFVGLSLTSVLASRGNNVIGIDVDVEKCKKIRSGISPFFEPDLEKMLRIGLKKKLTISDDFSLVKDCDIIFVAVGTPQKSNGAIPLQIFLHFSTSRSTPITLFPFDANTLVSDNPTKPKPITAIFILSSKFLILKIMPS